MLERPNPARRHCTYPRVTKRAAATKFPRKTFGHKNINHRGPPKIRLTRTQRTATTGLPERDRADAGQARVASGLSVGAGEGVTERVLEELVEDAYLRVMYSLPKSKRPIEFRERPVPEKH